MIENSAPDGHLPTAHAPTAPELLESGVWLIRTMDHLPAPWSGLPVEARLRLQPGSVVPSSLLDEHLPTVLAAIITELERQGERPPYILHPYGRLTIGGVFELGRLVVGDAQRSVSWTTDPRDFPLAPSASPPPPFPFARAIRSFTGVVPLERAISLRHGPSSPTPPAPEDLNFLFPEIEWIATYEGLPAQSLAVEFAGFDGAEPPDRGFPEETAGEEPPAAAEPRLFQCVIGPEDPTKPRDNKLRVGRNTVGVFLGPEEVGALAGGEVSDEELAFGDADHVVVQVQLTPLEPDLGASSVGPLLVPKVGRSATLPLSWEIPTGAKAARAQLAVTRDGRVISVAEIVGAVGKEAKLINRMAIGRPEADQPPVDHSMVLTSDGSGTPTLVVPGATRVELLPHLSVLSENIRDALNQVISIPDTTTARAKEAARKVLVAAALAGSDLCTELAPLLGDLQLASNVQVITALAPHALPMELLYLLPAPADDATICGTWLAGGECGPDCVDEEGGVVCPAGFWGVSRFVERHYQKELQGDAVLQVPSPDPARPRLRLDAVAYAASEKVTDQILEKADFDPTQRITTWGDWKKAVANGAGMLVLMPHTTPKPPALEISGHKLHRSRITKPYVTADPEVVRPAVVLFGCDTGGQQEDPVGYVTRFFERDAGVVFGSFSLLRAGTAAVLASRLVSALRDPNQAGQPVGRVLTGVRRDALHDGVWAALTMTAFGDSNWEV